MKQFVLYIVLLLPLSMIAQEQDSLVPQQDVPSALPMLLQQQSVTTQKPTMNNITSEIPNDTVKPTVRIKVLTTEELYEKQLQAEKAESAPVTDKVTAVDTKKHESTADASDKEVVPGRTYKVQVAAMQTENPQRLADIKKKVGSKVPVSVEVDGTLKKYVVGVFNTYYEAAQYRDSLVKKGFKGSFVVVYFKDKRVSRQEKALEKVKK